MKVIKITLGIALLSLLTCKLEAQTEAQDSTPVQVLDSVFVNTVLKSEAQKYLPDVQGQYVFAGKKTYAAHLSPLSGNLSQNITRLLFAKMPGVTTWEMDGAGTQVNIGSRGTDSHRSIEMNMRQNGYNTNSDMFGYPENHYTVPMQAVEEVQLVRGSAALQFGSQFGGMMNYVMKQGDTTKPLAIESEQTVGSNSFFNSYNAVGGTVGKLQYYAYYNNRSGNGWRPNAAFKYHAYYANLAYHFSANTTLALQFSRMDYVQQIAGGLTDAQFKENNRQSFRSRNFFLPEINIPALVFTHIFSGNTKLEVNANSIIGQRNSVQFINTPDVKDTFNTAIGSYNPRQVDRDYYNGFSTEARLLHSYNFGSIKSTLAAGLRYSTERTKREQKGVGTTGSNPDLALTKPYSIDLHFNTHNYAAFAENTFHLSKQFSVTPGVRYELIQTNLTGVINNATAPVSYKSNRSFPLFGAGLQYQLTSSTNFYGNISQAYRPYLYANVTPADRLDKIDPDLKDSKGYDIDLGYRGHYKNVLDFDVNAFYLFYGNKVGLLSQVYADNTTHLLTTNIGDAVTKGVEAFVEISFVKLFNNANKNTDVRLFNSLAYNHARYTKGAINKAGINTNIKNNFVENTPEWMNKTGLTLQHKTVTATVQYSYTSGYYNDALNTLTSANGVTGYIPKYHLWDATLSWYFLKNYYLTGGVNNLANAKYFNRRITMYPGPGILPADGRTFYVSFGLKL